MKRRSTRWLALAVLTAIVGVALWRLRTPIAPTVATQATERAKTPSGMVYIPGGAFRSGTDDPDGDEDVRPSRTVFVASFYLDRTEVTNAEFRRFRPAHDFPSGEENFPVTDVTYDDAAAYAKWAGKRLPTEAEWEKAARGTDGRRYPWGDAWDEKRVAPRARKRDGKTLEKALATKTAGTCRPGATRVRAVGSVASGVGPYGNLDMAGNAWEWVQGFYNGNPDMRILRGGAVGYGERACRTYNRAIEGSGAT